MFLCRCPNCYSESQLDDKYLGKRITCKKCSHSFATSETRELQASEIDEFLGLVESERVPPTCSASHSSNPELSQRESVTLGDVAQNFTNQWFANQRAEREHQRQTLVVLLTIVCIVMFFCCGLPMLLSAFVSPSE